MSQTLTEIAQQLRDTDKKVQLIYAFNGSGKTRLSREFKKLVSLKFDEIESIDDVEDFDAIGQTRNKILYYSALTEDLFYWDNDLEQDIEPKLNIQPNTFINWILKDQGLDQRIISNFQNLTGSKVNPVFNINKGTIAFTIPETFYLTDDNNNRLTDDTGNFLINTGSKNIKISKGEESNFIWSIFYTLLDEVVSILNSADIGEGEGNQFSELQYIFIDDPVTSLDENHLIGLAVNLASLIKIAPPNLKFIITTHSPLFYNVLYNELNKKSCYLFQNTEDGTFSLIKKDGDSNKSFSYHLYLKQTLEKAINENQIQKYHFTLLRNLYEKTASFLGYSNWSELLPDDKQAYLNRIIQFTSHSTLSDELVAEPTPQEKQTVKFLLEHLQDNYSYWQQKEQDA